MSKEYWEKVTHAIKGFLRSKTSKKSLCFQLKTEGKKAFFMCHIPATAGLPEFRHVMFFLLVLIKENPYKFSFINYSI